MVTINKKLLIRYAIFLCALFSCAFLVPFLRPPLMAVLRSPLVLVNLARREVAGMIFYHKNLVMNERLRSENEFLRASLSKSKETEMENERLSGLLSFKNTSGYKVLAARVIGRDPQNWSSGVIIDKGAANGIEKGSVCVTFLGLAGRIVEVEKRTSKVLLLNDPNLCVSCVVQRSRQEGLVCGSLGGTLTMKYLPRGCDARTGDVVVTSGYASSIYPKGLFVGTIAGVGDEFAGQNSYARIRPAVNYSGVEELLVVMD